MTKTRQLTFGVVTFFTGLFLFLSGSCTNPENREKSITSSEEYQLSGKEAQVYVTARNTDQRLAKGKPLQFFEWTQPDEATPTIMVDPDQTFQEILGIGGALTDAAAETFYALPESAQEEILKAYFDRKEGIGYSLCRTSIHSCDFSSESYAYTEIPDDTLLEHFSIERDRNYRIPFIKQALNASQEGFKLFASPWSPPAWMKTNGSMLQGGKLKPEYREAWADYYIRFIEAYDKEAIPIWGLTVQNEPMAVQTWESCIYTAEEERDFVKKHLGPAVKSSDYPDTKIIVWDHNRGIMYQRAKVVYDDPEASKYVWGTGFHWYVGDHFDNVRLHKEAFPDKKLLFTEGTVAPFNLDSVHLWKWGERYGESMIHDLNKGANGWVDWNVLLNENGGPNHVQNYCFAPIIGNTRTGEVIYMNSYYYMGHFSKFIRPGARRVTCSSNNDNLMATAFLNPDQSLAVVVMNMTGEDMDYRTWIDQQAVETTSPAHSIMTLVIG